MLRTLVRLGIAVPLALNIPILTASLSAQEPQSGMVCMAHPASSPDKLGFVAAIPPGEQQAFADRGFAPRDCAAGPGEIAAYRAKVCHLANDAPASVQAQFEQEYNVSPRELCDAANMLAGA